MDMDRYIGRLLDNRYEILEVIGTGGMAVVYKARCHRLNRLVAIKILKDDYSQDEEFGRRFHAESHAVAMLSHPNIVSIYDVSTDEDADYIVMELIEGITLKQYMEKKGVLNWKETLHFAIQIAKALEHAHSRGIIHRDIKPHNVMVLKNGSVKVTDFGIARVMSKSNTLTKEALGSVHYISPEQAKGGRVNNCSDLYSLGVVMYEMMTGRPPYDGETPVSVAIQHINGKAAMPSTVNPNIPGGLEQIIMKAMATDPASRYPTAAAMLYDMDEFRKNPAILFDYNNPTVAEDAALHMKPNPQKIDETMPMPKPPVEKTPVQNPAPRRREPQVPAKPVPQKPRRRYQEEVVEDDRDRGSKVAAVAIAACAVVAIVAIVLFVWALMNGDQSSEMITVPNLIGVYEEDLVNYSNLEIRVSERKHSDRYLKGQIMEQTPGANVKIAKGGKITVTVSLGSASSGKVMENLVGLDEKQARDFLNGQSLKLQIITRTETSATIPVGNVTRTEPALGEELSQGQTVTLWISTGPDVIMRVVPNVVNRSVDKAVSILKASGFENFIFEDVESILAKDTVVQQSVTGEVDINTEIVLQVSLGPSQGTEKPPVTNIPEIDPDLKFKVITVKIPEDAQIDEDYVVSIWFDGEKLEEQLVIEGAVSVQFEVSGKGSKVYIVNFNDEKSQQIEVDFDE